MLLHSQLISSKHLVEMFIKTRVFTKIKNWPVILGDYFNFSPGGTYLIHLNKKGLLRLRRGTTDKWSVHEIVLRDDYRISSLPYSDCNIVDLGANAGVFSIYTALLRPNAKIYSYEPENHNFSLLLGNIKLNHLPNVKPYMLACTYKPRSNKLYLGSDNRAYSLIKQPKTPFKLIKTTTLKKIFDKSKIHICELLKMDIEGSEYKVLYSCPKSLFKKIKRISLEYHNGDKSKNTGTELGNFLKKMGYKVEIRKSPEGIIGMIYAQRS